MPGFLPTHSMQRNYDSNNNDKNPYCPGTRRTRVSILSDRIDQTISTYHLGEELITLSSRHKESATLIRGVGGMGVALLALNSMIGAGIFALPGAVAVKAGDPSHWLFLGIGLMFITIVLSFAELSSYFKSSGGPILYTTAAFGPVVGFGTGWMFYVSRATAFAANITVMATYLGAIWPWLVTDTGRVLFILVTSLGLTAANYVGVKDGIRTIALFTFFKLVPMGLLILTGLKEITGDSFLPSHFPEIDDFGGLILLTIYAFVGFEGATTVSGETRNPQRTMPRSLILTVIGAAILYFMIVLVFVSVLPAGERAGGTLVDVGRKLAGDWGALIIGIAAVFSIGGNLAANMLAAPRLTFALGELRMLPTWFSTVHPRYFTPANSVLMLGGLCLVLALSGSFEFLAAASSLTRLITYVLCFASLPVIRRNATAEEKANAFRLKGGYAIPLTAFLLCLWIGSHASLNAWLVTGGLLAFGFVLYQFAQKQIRATTPFPPSTP